MGVSNTVQQLSVFLENREGRLEEVLDVLAKSNVNIVALSLADTSDYGMLRMIVSDPHKGRMALKEVGITSMLTDVVALRVPHATGSLNKAAEALYISQPSLTNAVKELEKELGIIIFNRSGRGVTLTNDGTEFLMYARQIYGQYESVVEKYSEGGSYKKKFGVSTQHYSFAVKAFVDMVQKFDVSEYEFAIRETKTADVISDVSTMKSEVGVLYLSDFNRKALLKLLHSANLEFHHLIDCQAYVYLWKNHPLANEKSISYSQLAKYPCLSFEQGDKLSLIHI